MSIRKRTSDFKKARTDAKAKVSRLFKRDIKYMDRARTFFESLRDDNWYNPYTGMGDELKDTTISTSFAGRPRIPYTILDRMFSQSAIANRISSRPAFDATRAWIELDFSNADESEELSGEIEEELKRLNAREIVREAITWARHYGGAIVVLGTDDEDEKEPIKENNIRQITHLRVYDRWQASPLEFVTNEQSPNFGLPIRYQISNALNGKTRVVHASRTLRFIGVKVPDRISRDNEGWGYSVIDQVFAEIRAYCSTAQSAESIIKEFTLDVFQIHNLQQLLASDDTEQIRERFRIIQMGKSILNAIIHGKDETYEKRTTSLAGFPETWEGFQYLLSAATGIPITFLFGRSPAGMNATGESDITNYYDQISGYQESDLRPSLTKLIHILLLQKEGPTGGEDPEGWTFVFNSLIRMTRKEEAEIEKMEAETDSARIADSVITPLEVRKSRFVGSDGAITIDEETTLLMEQAQGALTSGNQTDPTAEK